MLTNDNVIDLMREFSPKPRGETLFANTIDASVGAVSNRLREKTKSAVWMPQGQIINVLAVALIAASACASPPRDTEGVEATIVRSSDGVIARIIPPEPTSIPMLREITADFQSQLLPFSMKVPFYWKNYERKDNLDWKKDKTDTLEIETSSFYVDEDAARVVDGLTPKSGAINIAIRRIDMYAAKINLSPEDIKNQLIADGNKSYLGHNGKTITDKMIENDQREWIVDGHKAIRIDAERIDEGGVILRKGEVYIFEDENKNLWQIAFAADPNVFEEESAKFRHSLATFHLQEEQA